MKTKTRDLSTCLKRRLWIVGVCLTTFSFLSVSVAYAVSDNQTVQQQKKGMVIKGKVLGTDGEPIIGASVLVKGSTTGVVTDLDGNYTLSNVSKGAILEFSYVGYVKLTKTVGNETTINAILYEDSQMLEGVEVVAFGTQKKESVIGAISTVKVAELKTPSSNLTNALAGRIAGVISYQRTGEPGVDDASFFVRGVTTFGYRKDPLILIDGIELTSTDLARLQPDDIASFSIMKDATATALYGARGANGVMIAYFYFLSCVSHIRNFQNILRTCLNHKLTVDVSDNSRCGTYNSYTRPNDSLARACIRHDTHNFRFLSLLGRFRFTHFQNNIIALNQISDSRISKYFVQYLINRTRTIDIFQSNVFQIRRIVKEDIITVFFNEHNSFFDCNRLPFHRDMPLSSKDRQRIKKQNQHDILEISHATVKTE